MKVYLALANEGGGYVFKNRSRADVMNVYLAGCPNGRRDYMNSVEHSKIKDEHKVFVLESFYYITDWMIPYIKNEWEFLLDSGAFTFMNSKGSSDGVDWDEYVSKYANFINENDIKLFFELDIDSIVGLKEVERLRKKLEIATKKKCIPVWHKSRGLAYWKKMTKKYNYVAIGGIVTKEIKRKEYDVFIPLLQIAKDNNCKVHGLGFTNSIGMQKYKFDSVDSTAWVYGNRGGFLYKFNGRSLDKIQKPPGTRLNAKETAIHNFKEWVKFQKYAKNNL